ncbi:MAG: acyl carrier protein [Myxococcota bacterium]
MTQATTASRPTPSGDDLLRTLSALIRQVSPIGPTGVITAASRLREDLALDSVASLELLSMIDDQLGLCLEMEDVFGIETVGGIVAIAETRLAGAQVEARA